MIDVIAQEDVEQQDPIDTKALYERIHGYVGSTLRVRSSRLEVTATLLRVIYRRDTDRILFTLQGGTGEGELDLDSHVAVLIDGSWKILNRGMQRNREL